LSDAAPKLCLISGALVILHAYSPIVFFPKLSLLPKGATVPAKYYNNVGPIDDGEHLPGVVQRANATFLMLSRNDDVDRAVITIKELENRFNLKYGYPWVFLNEQPFSEDFKRWASPPLSVGLTEKWVIAVCRSLPRGRCTLAKSRAIIGTNQTGSMRPGPRKKGTRWRKRRLYMATVSRPSSPSSHSFCGIDVHIFRYRNMCRFNSGVLTLFSCFTPSVLH
jgi:hypothetical protein